MRRLFREYVDAMLNYELLADVKAAEAQLAQAEQLQNEIWSHVRISSSSDTTHDSVRLRLPALYEMIDVTTARTVALHMHLPWPIFSLLVIVPGDRCIVEQLARGVCDGSAQTS